jgi:hypothetical protein
LRRTTHTLPLSSPLTHTHSDHCTSEDATRGLEVLRSRLCAFVERSVAAQEEAGEGEGEGDGADRAAEPSRRDIAIGEIVQSLLQASTRTVSGADSLDHVLSIFCDCNLFIVRCVNTPRTKIGEACKDDGVFHFLPCSPAPPTSLTHMHSYDTVAYTAFPVDAQMGLFTPPSHRTTILRFAHRYGIQLYMDFLFLRT